MALTYHETSTNVTHPLSSLGHMSRATATGRQDIFLCPASPATENEGSSVCKCKRPVVRRRRLRSAPLGEYRWIPYNIAAARLWHAGGGCRNAACHARQLPLPLAASDCSRHATRNANHVPWESQCAMCRPFFPARRATQRFHCRTSPHDPPPNTNATSAPRSKRATTQVGGRHRMRCNEHTRTTTPDNQSLCLRDSSRSPQLLHQASTPPQPDSQTPDTSIAETFPLDCRCRRAHLEMHVADASPNVHCRGPNRPSIQTTPTPPPPAEAPPCERPY